MIRNCLLIVALAFAGSSAAQVTDPMIVNWWFNTTNNMYKGILTDVEAVYYNTQYVWIKSSGIPKYYLDGQSVNNGVDQDATWQLPRVPQQATNPAGVQGGQTGLMLDGSVFFHPGDAQSYNNAGVWNRLAYYFEGMDMDASNGHSTPTNVYHHHFDNLQLHGWDSTKHSPLVAYAWDGYPVYGPFGYKDANDPSAGVRRIRSGYKTKTYTTRTNGPNVGGQYPIGCFIEDWEYTQGFGDLDEYNGRFCKTPEYPNGTYAYFTTVDENLDPYYPYFIGPKFYGTFSNANVGPNGGNSTIPGGTTQYTPNSVKEVEEISGNVEMFPVPVIADLDIRLKENRPCLVTLYNTDGKILQQKAIGSSAKIDMRDLPYGVYFIGVADESNGSGFIRRIVKQ